jgi:hypothetical protein
MHAYGRWIIRRYLGNALKVNRFATPPRSDSDFIGWAEGHGRLLRLPSCATALLSHFMLRERLSVYQIRRT